MDFLEAVFCLLAMAGTIPLGVLFIKKSRSRITVRQFFLFYAAVLLLANANWLRISYDSYYRGMASQIRSDNEYLLNVAAREVFNSGAAPEEMLERYRERVAFSRSGIKITRAEDGRVWLVKPPSFKDDAVADELETDRKNSKAIDTAIGKLYFEFAYSVRPVFLIGLLRANTCSLSDVFTEKAYRGLPFHKKIQAWWSGLEHPATAGGAAVENGYAIQGYRKSNFKRSNNLWEPFAVLFLLTLYILLIRQKLLSANKELSASNRELSEFKTIHDKMYSDLVNETNQLKQPIQEFNFSWDYYIDQIFRTERHDFKNKMSALSEDFANSDLSDEERAAARKLKTEYVDKMVNAILDNMKNLPEIVKYELADTPAADTIAAIVKPDESIPKSFSDGTAGRSFQFALSDRFAARGGEFCKINSHRLSSIVFNILANANKATQARKDALRAAGGDKKYIRRIWLDIDRHEEGSRGYVKVSIRDNAGGFPDEIKDRIYKSPVESSKKNSDGTSREGEGTVYVNFFAKYMKINIEAKNCTSGDGSAGAEVGLFIPIFTETAETAGGAETTLPD